MRKIVLFDIEVNMQTISVSDLQQNLGLYLKKVKDGDEIIVEETGEAIARILPFDENNEEQTLVSQGFMTLPKNKLSEDFWNLDAPEVSMEKIVELIRSERDED
jgi:prevent-host-death family protein